ncbi:MAG TPA: hypothetical protein VGM90_29385 [Kofleriaceae bacterium]
MKRALVVLVAAVPALAAANGRPPMTNGVLFRAGDAKAVYVATTFGLFVSTDECRFTWFCETDIGFGGEFDPHYAVTPAGTILATTFQSLHVSRDAGCSFQRATSDLAPTAAGTLPTAFFDALAVGPDGAVWIGSADTGSNAVYVSTDDARTFMPIDGLPSTLWFHSIAPADAARVYVTGVDISNPPQSPSSHWFRTNDDGITWTELGTAGVMWGSEPDLRIAAVSPTDHDVLLVRSVGASSGLGDRLYRSSDGGTSLVEVLATDEPITGVVFRDASTVLVATTNSGAWTSADSGATFTPLVGAPHLACLAQRSDGVLFGCAANYADEHMALARSTDGRTWEPVVRFEYLSGPADCPIDTPEHATCSNQEWSSVATQLGVQPSTCASGPDLHDAAPSTNAAGCCDANASAPSLLVLGAVLAAISRRRR